MEQKKSRSIYFLFLMIGIYLSAFMIQTHLLLNWDVSWLMGVTDRLLAGGEYGRDFFETNPPLILYLYIPPVVFSKIFSINIILALRIYVFFLASFSLYFCCFSVKKIFPDKDIFIARIFFIFLTLIFLILPLYEFGQREHLLIIFVMPYLLLVASRLQGNVVPVWQASGIGLLAGLGFAMKPFFLPTLLFVELYYAYLKRNLFASLRTETFCMAALFIIYAVTTFIFYRNYFSIIVPYALQHLWNIQDLKRVISFSLVWNCWFAILFYGIRYKANPHKNLSTVLLLAMIGFLLSYILQRTLYYYHIFPAFSLALLTIIFLFSLWIKQLETSKQDILIGMVFCILLFLFQYFYHQNIGLVALTFREAQFFLFFFILFSILFYAAKGYKNLIDTICFVAAIILMNVLFSHMARRSEWYAYLFPMTIFFLMTSFYLLLSFCSQVREKLKYFMLAVLGAFIFSSPYLFFLGQYSFHALRKEGMNNLITYMQMHTKNKSVYFLSVAAIYANPAVDYAKSQNVSRFSFFWMIPSIVNESLTHKKSEKEKNWVANRVAEDFKKHHPDFVFVDKINYNPKLNTRHFNLLNYFLHNQQFKKEWSAYCYLATINEPPSISLFQKPYQFEVYQRCHT